MNTLPIPSQIIKLNWLKLIREDASLAENAGNLTERQLQLAYEQKWFKLFVPKKYNGLEVSLPEALALEEALAWADGSFGWTITLCAGAGWFAGFMDQDFAGEVFRDDKVCLGGSGAPTGTAKITDAGYRVTGKWKYATGTAHLSHFTANCVITKENKPVVTDAGVPVILPFIFPKDQVTVIPDWRTIGLVATSSNAFEINNVEVPANCCFKIDSAFVKHPNPVYRYPFLHFAEATLAANFSGMALHFIDCAEDLFAKRIENKIFEEPRKQVLNDALVGAKIKVAEAREDFYRAIDKSWNVPELSDSTVLEEVSIASRNLAAQARKQVYLLFPLCGLKAADPETEINRVWRDMHTASQHPLLNFPYP